MDLRGQHMRNIYSFTIPANRELAIAQRGAGKSLSEIATVFNLTKSAVSKMLIKHYKKSPL